MKSDNEKIANERELKLVDALNGKMVNDIHINNQCEHIKSHPDLTGFVKAEHTGRDGTGRGRDIELHYSDSSIKLLERKQIQYNKDGTLGNLGGKMNLNRISKFGKILPVLNEDYFGKSDFENNWQLQITNVLCKALQANLDFRTLWEKIDLAVLLGYRRYSQLKSFIDNTDEKVEENGIQPLFYLIDNKNGITITDSRKYKLEKIQNIRITPRGFVLSYNGGLKLRHQISVTNNDPKATSCIRIFEE